MLLFVMADMRKSADCRESCLICALVMMIIHQPTSSLVVCHVRCWPRLLNDLVIWAEELLIGAALNDLIHTEDDLCVAARFLSHDATDFLVLLFLFFGHISLEDLISGRGGGVLNNGLLILQVDWLEFSAKIELIHLANLRHTAFSIGLNIFAGCVTNQLPVWIKKWMVQEQRVTGSSCSDKTRVKEEEATASCQNSHFHTERVTWKRQQRCFALQLTGFEKNSVPRLATGWWHAANVMQ